nr:hypothetical protein [Tanacetum cinerariifolium]
MYPPRGFIKYLKEFEMRGYELTLTVQGNLIDSKGYREKMWGMSQNEGDVEELWDELAKLEASMKMWESLEVGEEKEIQVFWFKEVKEGRIEEDVAGVTDINAVEPTVFDDEEMAKRLQDEEIEQAAAREKQEKEDLERDKVLQHKYDQKQESIDWNVVAKQMQEKHLDNINKYQSLKRKPISVAQARKNMIFDLKNMAGYTIQHFKGMTYDQVRPIFEREYNKVQTFLKSDRDEEPTKKRATKDTLLQETFKRLRAEVEVSGSHFTQQEKAPTVDPAKVSKEDVQNMLQIVPMAEFKVEALQFKYPLIDWEIYLKGSRTY